MTTSLLFDYRGIATLFHTTELGLNDHLETTLAPSGHLTFKKSSNTQGLDALMACVTLLTDPEFLDAAATIFTAHLINQLKTTIDQLQEAPPPPLNFSATATDPLLFNQAYECFKRDSSSNRPTFIQNMNWLTHQLAVHELDGIVDPRDLSHHLLSIAYGVVLARIYENQPASLPEGGIENLTPQSFKNELDKGTDPRVVNLGYQLWVQLITHSIALTFLTGTEESEMEVDGTDSGSDGSNLEVDDDI